MFGFVKKKDYNALVEAFETIKCDYKQACKVRDDHANTIDLLTEDNQILATTNEYYLKRYTEAQNIIRVLKNESTGIVIPEKCPHCEAVMIYNENLHMAICPDCKTRCTGKEK